MKFNTYDIINAHDLLDKLEEIEELDDLNLMQCVIITLVALSYKSMTEEELLTYISEGHEFLKKRINQIRKNGQKNT